MSGRTRALVIVLDYDITELDATNVRQGLRAFAGVSRVFPVDRVPSEAESFEVLRQQVMREGYQDLQSAQDVRDLYGERIRLAVALLNGDIDAGAGIAVPEPRTAEQPRPIGSRPEGAAS